MSDDHNVYHAPVSGTLEDFSVSIGDVPQHACPVCAQNVVVKAGDRIACEWDRCGVMHIRVNEPEPKLSWWRTLWAWVVNR